MKKILLGLLLLATAATINAQIELQQVLEEFSIARSINNNIHALEDDPLHRMVGLDDLFLLRHQPHDNGGDYDDSYIYHFYDADCNLYKRLKEIDDGFMYEVKYIARNVFTTDGKICRFVGKYEYIPDGYGGTEFRALQIIDEDGKVLQEITWDDKYGRYEDLELIKVGNKYKLLLYTVNYISHNDDSMGYDKYYYVHIYSCPGNGETTTSVQNVPAKVKRNAYPNPATDLVTLPYDANGSTSMKIYDMQGKLVERKFLDKNKQELQLNVKNYTSGMYFFEVNGESNSFIVE